MDWRVPCLGGTGSTRMKPLTPKEEKAVRLVHDEKVWLKVRVTAGNYQDTEIVGVVYGDTGVYHCRIDPEGKWCDCENGKHTSPHANCSHVLAVQVAYEYGKDSR